MQDKENDQGAESTDRESAREADSSRGEAIPGGSLQRRVETMPDGRYIIYYSWEEE